MNLTIGVDFDNTIITYDDIFYKTALEKGLINKDIRRHKTVIRDHIRDQKNGEVEWQRLQAYVYGSAIAHASPSKGVAEFFKLCKRLGIQTYIISHKTKHSNLGEDKTDFQNAALDWLTKQDFFDNSIDKSDVFFEPTKDKKIARIRTQNCTHFIDDLEETFENPNFPNITKILYSPEDIKLKKGMSVYPSWENIIDFFSLKQLTLLPELIGDKISTNQVLSEGRNSKIFVVEANKKFIAKIYYQNPFDKRDRRKNEYVSTQFLWERGIRNIPKPVATDPDHNISIYEHIDGESIKDVTAEDITDAAQFLIKLDSLKLKAPSELVVASEACFSIEKIFDSVDKRLKRLNSAADSKTDQISQKLTDYLEAFNMEYANVLEWVKKISKQKSISMNGAIPDEEKTLSPSDFGFHNALRTADSIVYFDFEYFGWDDPAKTISDFILHPAMKLSTQHRKEFVNRMKEHFGIKIFDRFLTVYPIFGLKWCMILLNEFVPEDFLRRRFSRKGYIDIYALQKKQLHKAEKMLAKVKEYIHADVIPWMQDQ